MFNIPEQEHILNTHIDQLAQWWENAEVPKVIEAGDIVIEDRRHCEGGFEVWPAPRAHVETFDNRRILERAPKPKPAWHDAVAVIAHTDEGHVRQIWERDGDTPFWCGTEGYLVPADTLRDVTPLIEAKVTDEMIERGQHIGAKGRKPDAELVRRVLTVALGLEAE